MNPLIIFAKRFIAGITPADAIKTAQSLLGQGINANINVLGEHVDTKEDALSFVQQNLDLIDHIRKSGLELHISLKLTQLGLDISDEVCLENVKTIVRAAKEGNIFVRIDMESTSYTDRTLGIFFKTREAFDNVGIVLRAYLHRNPDDIQRVLGTQSRIRLCKGAYNEPLDKAVRKADEVRKVMIEQLETLLKSGIYHAVATHDDEVINHLKQFSQANQIPKSLFEFQMLYGLRRKTWSELVSEGFNVRIYVPFGENWFPYFSRRLRERKENVFFILRNLFRK